MFGVARLLSRLRTAMAQNAPSAPVSVSSARTSDGAAYDTVESDTKTGPTTLRDPVHSPAALDEGRTSEFMDCKFQARAFPYSASKRLHAFSACGSL